MENYTSNSHKSKDEEKKKVPVKKVEKITGGSIKKKSLIAEVLISEDIKNVKDYILTDVLIPAVKKAISDAVTNGIDMILYGETSSNRKGSLSSKVSYRSYYDRNNDRKSYYAKSRNEYSYDDVVIDTRGEAEEVLMKMDELIDIYGMVSVADFYDLVGVSSNYTDNNYGWTNIRGATVVRTRNNGYMIKLPKALPLD